MTHGLVATNGSINMSPDWRAGLWAGLIAGLAFMMMEMGLVWLV